MFDFNLAVPDILKLKIAQSQSDIISAKWPIAEGISNTKNRDELFMRGIEMAAKAQENAAPLQKEIMAWIKSEKNSLEEIVIF